MTNTETNFDTAVPLKRMVNGLGLSSSWGIPPTQEGDNEYVTWNHDNPQVDGKNHGIVRVLLFLICDDVFRPLTLRQGTGAFFSSVHNSKDGVIMFVSNYGPKSELRENAEVEYGDRGTDYVEKFIREYELPGLNHVSDVTALEYGAQCEKRGHSTKGLSKLVMVASQAHAVVQVVDYLLKKEGIEPMAKSRDTGLYKAPDWPHKITYHAGSDEFNLLLATPNGNLATFLMIQHRQEFGIERVSKIDVFDDDHYDVHPEDPFKGASMVYFLEDLDNKGQPVAKAGASGSGSNKKPSRPSGSGGKPNRVEKTKSGGGRQGLRSGSVRHGSAKLLGTAYHQLFCTFDGEVI